MNIFGILTKHDIYAILWILWMIFWFTPYFRSSKRKTGSKSSSSNKPDIANTE